MGGCPVVRVTVIISRLLNGLCTTLTYGDIDTNKRPFVTRWPVISYATRNRESGVTSIKAHHLFMHENAI